MQDTKSNTNANNSMLCFIILTSITDDQFANSLMHDLNLQFKVDLYRLPTRRYMFTPEKSSKLLAASLLGNICEYLAIIHFSDFPIYSFNLWFMHYFFTHVDLF